MKNGLTVLMVLIAVATATASYVSFTPLDSARNYVELPGDLRANGGSSVVSRGAMNVSRYFTDANLGRKTVHAGMTGAALDSDGEMSSEEDGEAGEDVTQSRDDKKRKDRVREG